MRRRPTRPGVTAAATTAVFATGDGLGVTALATTAVFATGWPMTPTLPTRAALRGMSDSFGCGGFICFDRGDDRLNGDPSVGDQLATRTSRCRCEWRGPQVFPDEHSGGAAGLHGICEVLNVFLRQQFRQLGLERLKLSQLLDVGKLHGIDGSVLVLSQDQDVDKSDGA